MGLFGLSKKERDLKALSEKEIQLRLYGHLRAPHAASHDKGAIAHNKPIRPVILGPQVRTVEERKPAPVQTQTTESAPSHVRTTHPPKPETGDDLFSTSTQEAPKARPAVTQQQPRVSKPAPYASQSSKPAAPKKNIFAGFTAVILNKVVPAVWTVVKGVLVFAFQLIAALIGFISSSLLKIDFKNPRVRRIFSWTLGLGLLAFLLIGIHILNLKREVAMKHPKKVTIAKKKDVIPQQVAVQTLASDAAAESATADESVLTPATTVETPVAPAVSQKGQVIQIATFATLSDAEKLVAKLKQSGWPSFAKPLVRTGGKTYYCVFLGAFKSSQEAETKLAEFKKKEISKSFQDAFVRTL